MWILESAGDTLKGNKYWLRPGHEYTIGRDPLSRISLSAFKTVSKTHVTIKVGAVSEGSASNLATRSTITIQDHDSKFGTWLNGTDIKTKTVPITMAENTLKLAKLPENLRLHWQPLVLTNAGCRSTKIKQLLTKLEPFDVKIIKEYASQTTYVMSPKLNTAKGLAALIHQKYIVTDLFGDSLYSALTAIEDILDPDSMPDPAEYLPITDDYPADFFKPNPGRIELFKGVTFIFLDEGQYNNLVTPISAGLGKAVIYNANGKTVDDLVKFASDKGQTLLVQRNVGDQDTFCVEASHRLGHQAITQSSLLAPIMQVDGTLLLKPIEPSNPQASTDSTFRPSTPESSSTLVPPVTEIPNSVEGHPTRTEPLDTNPDIPPPAMKKIKPRARPVTNTQVDLFDDFFTRIVPKKPTIKQSPAKTSTNASMDPFPDFSSPTKPSPKTRQRRKSPTPEPEEDFAPAATEMKAHLAKTQISQPESDSDLPSNPKTKAPKGKKRAVPEDDEVLTAARERKRAALEQSRQAAEELAAAVKDHGHLKNLGEVELFEVDLSAAKAADRQERSARWDPAWNGRKNFKRFRRAKQSVSVGVGRAMIQLVDYKGKSAASQEFFFLSPENERGRKEDPSSDDFAMEMTPAQAGSKQSSSRASNGTQRNSGRGSARSGRGSRQTLFVQDDASDNDLGFDD